MMPSAIYFELYLRHQVCVWVEIRRATVTTAVHCLRQDLLLQIASTPCRCHSMFPRIPNNAKPHDHPPVAAAIILKYFPLTECISPTWYSASVGHHVRHRGETGTYRIDGLGLVSSESGRTFVADLVETDWLAYTVMTQEAAYDITFEVRTTT